MSKQTAPSILSADSGHPQQQPVSTCGKQFLSTTLKALTQKAFK